MLTFVLAAALAQLEPLPSSLVPLDSDQGRVMLTRAQANRAFFPLVSNFVTQETTSYCGVAASVMVLNALPIEAPVAKPWAPFRQFTQENVFGQGELKAETVRKGGLTIDQLVYLLDVNHATAKPVHASESTAAEFREQAAHALAQPNQYVVIDFWRGALGQDVGAHWSPLGAYDAASDSFLVLDVARFRYPPYWAKANELFKAMSTTDLDSGKSRGWVLVSVDASAPPRAAVPPLGHRLIYFAGGAALIAFFFGALVGALIAHRRR